MKGYHPSDDGAEPSSASNGVVTTSVMHEETVPLTVSTTPQVPRPPLVL